jgi:hypothetical protein
VQGLLQTKQNSNSFSNSKHIQMMRTSSIFFSNQGKITCSSSNLTKFKFIFTSNDARGLQIKQSSSVEKKLQFFKSNKLMQFEVVIFKEIASIQICNSTLEYFRARIEHKEKNLKFPVLLCSILKHIIPLQ